MHSIIQPLVRLKEEEGKLAEKSLRGLPWKDSAYRKKYHATCVCSTHLLLKGQRGPRATVTIQYT